MGHVLRRKVDKWIKADRSKRAKRIIRKYSTQLTKAAMRKVSEGATLASSLYNENYIHDRYFQEMIKTVNRAEPELDMVYASTMVSAIRRIVYSDPEAFPGILKILKCHEAIKVVALKMEKEYYEDEDIIVKLLVFGSTGICTFILFLMLLVLIVWNYLSSPTECLKLTQDVKESILLTLTNSNFVSETLNDSKCDDLFEQYSLPYEEFKSQCIIETKDHIMDLDACIGKLIIEATRELCVESIYPVLGCVGVNLNITELSFRTFTRNSDNVSKTEL